METSETPDHDPEPDEQTPTLDDVLEILQNERRRYALFYLKHTDGHVKIGKLTEQVAAWENNIHPDKISAKQRKRVYIALYQNHLSRMAEDDIVEYNSDRGIVSRGKYTDIVEYYMGGPLSETPPLSSDITFEELRRDSQGDTESEAGTERTSKTSQKSHQNRSYIQALQSVLMSSE